MFRKLYIYVYILYIHTQINIYIFIHMIYICICIGMSSYSCNQFYLLIPIFFYLTVIPFYWFFFLWPCLTLNPLSHAGTPNITFLRVGGLCLWHVEVPGPGINLCYSIPNPLGHQGTSNITFIVCPISIFLFRKIKFSKNFKNIFKYLKSKVGKLRSVCIFYKPLLISLKASTIHTK